MKIMKFTPVKITRYMVVLFAFLICLFSLRIPNHVIVTHPWGQWRFSHGTLCSSLTPDCLRTYHGADMATPLLRVGVTVCTCLVGTP